MGTGYGKPAGFMGGFGAMKLRMMQLAAVAVLLLFIVALMREKSQWIYRFLRWKAGF